MPNPFQNISNTIETHPVISSVIFGGFALAATIAYTKYSSNKKSQSGAVGQITSGAYTDAYGNVYDASTGQPLGNSAGGGFALQPTNANADVLSSIQQLNQQLLNLIASMGGQGTPNTNQPTNADVYSLIQQKNQQLLSWIASMGRLGIPDTNQPPGPNGNTTTPSTSGVSNTTTNNGGGSPNISGGNAVSDQHFVTVAKWSASNTPWNSTLWGIAHHYGETVAQIQAKNPSIKNPNLIYPGQRVFY